MVLLSEVFFEIFVAPPQVDCFFCVMSHHLPGGITTKANEMDWPTLVWQPVTDPIGLRLRGLWGDKLGWEWRVQIHPEFVFVFVWRHVAPPTQKGCHQI
jgi:hypothetical protein